ncbi:MAG: mannitol dehydrogenase family protein [Streptosporangiaceae bacterium]
MERLSLASLPGLPRRLRPRVDPAGLRVGIVHLGIGAFHRAHQAVYTDDALAASPGDWGICGVTERSAAVVRQLRPQDGLYTVLERGEHGVGLRTIGAVRDVLFAGESPRELRNLLADPAVRIVTITVTEKGYHHDPASGRLRIDDPTVGADLGGGEPRTVVGQLVRGLEARRTAEAGPLTVVSCDNLPGNGRLLRGLVEQFCLRLPPGEGDRILGWMADHVTFPNTVVDRIVPATTSDDLAAARERLGVADEGVVVAEPFSQWVIEDRFVTDRPRWEAGGAVLTDDPGPYEDAKLRLLNGSHSALAYLGALGGFTHIADAVREPLLAEVVDRLMRDDVVPTLREPPGVDLGEYCHTLLTRFANPALRHRTTQVAMDGSQKLPQRLLGTARDRLAAGAEPRYVTLAVAAWMRYVSAAESDDGAPLPVDDPLADRLRVADPRDPHAVAAGLFGLTEAFGEGLPASPVFRDLVTGWLERLTAKGVLATVRDALR